MPSPRLSAALQDGSLTLPDRASVLVVGASDVAAVSGLAAPGGDLHIVQPMQPAFDTLAASGHAVSPDFPDTSPPLDLAYVALPRARALARDWVSRAAASLRAGGVLVVEGAKTDGIDSLYRAARGALADGGSLTKAHGRVFWGRPERGAFDDWRARPTAAEGFVTAAGAFSADGIDAGSAALADALPQALPPRLADLGAGWGYLAARALSRRGVAELHLVEADHAALAAARCNVPDPRARFHWADATGWSPPQALDGVVMNPPFHTGRAATPQLGRAFIARAGEILAPQGQLWLVANRHLPYEDELTARFAQWREIGGTSAFKLIHAAGPRRSRRRDRR